MRCHNRIDMGRREGELLLVKGEDWRYDKSENINNRTWPILRRGHLFRGAPSRIRALYLGCCMLMKKGRHNGVGRL